MTQDTKQSKPEEAGPSRFRHKIFWLLAGIFTTYIVLNTVMFWVSLEGRPDLVSKDYYERSKTYDQELTQRETSRQLGWRISLIPPGDETTSLAVWITDRSGAPLQGLTGELRAYRPSDASLDQSLPLNESPAEPGMYRTAPAALQKGLWEFTVSLNRGDAAFAETIRHKVK